MGQTQREAVAEEKHKPWSFFVVLHAPAGPGPGVPGSAGSQAGQAWGPSPRRASRCAEVPGAHGVEPHRVPTGKEPQAWKLASQRPNWLTLIFFSMQRTSCKPSKNSDHLTGRTTSSAQKLLFKIAY